MKRKLSGTEEIVHNWGVDEVVKWLENFGFAEFVAAFINMQVGGDFLLQLFEMEDADLANELFKGRILWARKFKLEGKKPVNFADRSREAVMKIKMESSSCDITQQSKTIINSSNAKANIINGNSNNMPVSQKKQHSAPQKTPRAQSVTSTSPVQLSRSGSNESRSGPRIATFPPLRVPSVEVVDESTERDHNTSDAPPPGRGKATALALTLAIQELTPSQKTKSPVEPAVLTVVKKERDTKVTSSSSTATSSGSTTSSSKSTTFKRRQSSLPESTTNVDTALDTTTTSLNAKGSDPRGPPVMLTRLDLLEEPFNWYWIDNKSATYLNTFWYITKCNPQGERYTSTKALLEGVKRGEVVLNVDFFPDETGWLDKAIFMYKDTHNYHRNLRSNFS